MVKRILSISTWILSACGIIALLGFARYTHYNKPIKGLQVWIKGQKDGNFLDYAETSGAIRSMIGSDLYSPIRSIHVLSLQKTLQANPWLEKAEAATTIEGYLKVKLYERKPIVRIYTESNQVLYMDEKGILFPIHPDYTAHVLVSNGNIDAVNMVNTPIVNTNAKGFNNQPIKAIHKLAIKITKDPFLSLLVDQIYFNPKKEIELALQIGDAEVILGDASQLDQKMDNLATFYKAKATSAEISNYTKINARFINQIVCTKKDSL